MPDPDCGKSCPHRRAFEYALQYFATEHDAQVVNALVRRYRESLRRQGGSDD